jgi:hypothetical protein
MINSCGETARHTKGLLCVLLALLAQRAFRQFFFMDYVHFYVGDGWLFAGKWVTLQP